MTGDAAHVVLGAADIGMAADHAVLDEAVLEPSCDAAGEIAEAAHEAFRGAVFNGGISGHGSGNQAGAVVVAVHFAIG